MGVSRRRASLVTLTGSSINTIIVSIQAIVLVPFYLQAIGPKIYGAWLGSGDFLVWMQAFDLGIPSLIIQRIGAAYGEEDYKSVGEYLAASICVLTLVASVLAIIAAGFSFVLPNLMSITGADARVLRECFVVSAFAAAIGVANNSVVGFSRGIQDTGLLSATLVISAVTGLAVSLGLILSGWGLWSIALGMASRALVSFIGSLLFVAKHLRGNFGRFFRVRKNIVREIIMISPVTALGGLGYALMSQSESALVAILIRPEMAVVMTVTRRAVDVARSLVDAVGMATYGGFAHLVNSSERSRALKVHSEIHAFRLSIAISMAAAYMTVNASLISVWVGPDQYGGSLLTILIAMQFIIAGSSYLMNYLYRATGPVMKGSALLLAECIIRLPIMIILLRWFGLPGLPMSAILTGLPFGWLAFRWTQRQVSIINQKYPGEIKRIWFVRVIIVALGISAASLVYRPSWVFVILAGSIVAIGSTAAFILLDPRLNDIRTFAYNAITRFGSKKRGS
jgi:O-antigen/teichoic acid export membrane protein